MSKKRNNKNIAGINLSNSAGYTVLHEAVLENRVQRVQALLRVENIRIDVECHLGNTPLHLACENEQTSIKIIKMLLKVNADINKRNNAFITPLHVLCTNSISTTKVQKLDLLLNIPHINLDPKDYFQETPLFWLLTKSDYTCIDMLLHCGADANTHRLDGCTPLMIAAQSSDSEAVKILTPFVTDINHTNIDGRTTLMLGANDFAVTSLLLSNGADPNIVSTDGTEVTALHLAVNYRQPEVVRLLLTETDPDILLNNKNLNILYLLWQAAENEDNIENIILCTEALLESNLNPSTFHPFIFILFPNVLNVSDQMWETYKTAIYLFFSIGITLDNSKIIFDTYHKIIRILPFNLRALELIDILINHNLDIAYIDLRDPYYNLANDYSPLYNIYFLQYTLLNDAVYYLNQCLDAISYDPCFEAMSNIKNNENLKQLIKKDCLKHCCREVIRSNLRKKNLSTQKYIKTLYSLNLPKSLIKYIQYKF